MKCSTHGTKRVASLSVLACLLLLAPAVLQAQAAVETDQDRTAPILLNEDEVAAKLNDAVRDQVRGLKLEADGEVKVVVDEDGMPVRHWLTMETGYEVLDRAIGEVVAVMRFKPASEAGRPVSCVAVIPVAFRPGGADLSPKAVR